MARRPKHLRPKRTRGFRLLDGRGRRRRTRAEEGAPDPDELAKSADRAAASRTWRRVAGAFLLAGLVVAVAVGATLVAFRPDRDPPQVGPPGEEGASLLLLAADPSRQAASLALVTVRPGHPSFVVLFPPALLLTVPGYGDGLLGTAIRFEGPELAELTVSNLLGVRVDDSVTLPPGALAELLTGPLVVDLPVPLLVEEPDGGQLVVAAPGAVARDPETVERLLVDEGVGDQLAWLQRQAAVWEALLREAGADGGLAARLASFATGPAGRAAEVLSAAGRDEERVVTAVPVSRIAVGGETERYQLSGEEAVRFVDGRFDYLRLRAEPRPRVEVLNGNGRVGTTRAVSGALIRRGFRVVKTDNADRFDYPVTQVIAQGAERQLEAVEVQRILGSGEVLLELRRPSGVVDLTIIVGHDIPAEEG